MVLHYFGVALIISCVQLCKAMEQCRPSTYSQYGHHLSGHIFSTRISSSISECVIICSNELRCKSLNFRIKDKSCDLNDADKHTHPEDYGPKEGSVYMDTSKRHKKGGFKSCSAIKQEWPRAESGYYWIKIGDRDAQVYCDMKNHGGGWTLAVSISSENNDHLQTPANNCFNSVLCVPFTNNQKLRGRKLSDSDIHKLAQTEGTFRVDVLKKNGTATVYYQVPSGAENFNSSCSRGRVPLKEYRNKSCPRIIISHSYPYQWETNSCKSIDVGYRIWPGCHSVFDGHDDAECHQKDWRSSQYLHGIRALYGYPCPELPAHDSFGIYINTTGMLYVK